MGRASGQTGKSVSSRLRVAFLAIAVFALLAALVGMASLRMIDVAQDHMLDDALPAMQTAKSLQDLGLEIIVDAADVTSIEDPDSFTRLYSELSGAMVYARSKLSRLRDIDAESVERIDATLRAMSDNIRELFQLVEQRYILGRSTNDRADEAAESASLILSRLAPANVDAMDKLFRDMDDLRAMATSPDMQVEDVNRLLDDLGGRDIFNIQTILVLRSRVEDMRDISETLRATTDPSQIDILRDRFLLDVRHVARAVLDLQDESLKAAIGAELGLLNEQVLNEDGLVAVRNRFADITRGIDDLDQENTDLGRQLGNQVTSLFQTVEGMVEDDASSVSDIVRVAQYALIAIAFVAFLVAGTLAWRMVMRGVALRLRLLSDATLAIAKGDLQTEVTVSGSDELGEMASAVRQFRTNAIELQRTNAELAQFAYVASHDLKAPLRGIADLTGFLEQDLQGRVDAESLMHMELIKSRVARLERLLDDLLNYSRVGRDDAEIANVDVLRLVQDAFDLVAPADRIALVIATDLPVIETAQAPLEQFFRNLLSNACLHHDKPKGLVTVSARDEGTRWRFEVSDDGPGIAPEHHERIFGMFQTLRARDELESSGMGLAILRKIAQSIDCTIEVDPKTAPGEGSTIAFTWPKVWPRTPGADVTAKAA